MVQLILGIIFISLATVAIIANNNKTTTKEFNSFDENIAWSCAIIWCIISLL